MYQRRYNKILGCERTVTGAWHIAMLSPVGTFLHKTYIGYSKREAIRLAKREPDDTIVNHPPRRSTISSRQR